MLRRCGAALLIAVFMLATGMLASYARRVVGTAAAQGGTGASDCHQVGPGVCLSGPFAPMLASAAPGHRPRADLPLMDSYGD